MTTGDQNHALALAIIERKNAEIAALTQRVEAAEAERDRLADDRARFPDRPDDVGRMIEARRGSLEDGIKSANAYAREAINRAEKAEAERDALRTVDDAMVERAWQSLTDVCGVVEFDEYGSPLMTPQIDCVDRADVRAALDAALAVQPTTAGM